MLNHDKVELIDEMGLKDFVHGTKTEKKSRREGYILAVIIHVRKI